MKFTNVDAIIALLSIGACAATESATIAGAGAASANKEEKSAILGHLSDYKYYYIGGTAFVAICGVGAYLFKDKLCGSKESDF